MEGRRGTWGIARFSHEGRGAADTGVLLGWPDMLLFGVGHPAGADADNALSGWGVLHVLVRAGLHESFVFPHLEQYSGVDV